MANFMDSEARAEENRSSAWTLLIVGGVGLIALVLCILGVIKLPLSGFGMYIFYGVLGVLFVVFFVSGIISFKKVKVYSAEATEEKSKRKQIMDWCIENEVVAKINESVPADVQDMSGEELYFNRFDKFKRIVFVQFQDMGFNFLENIIDELYDELFED